MLKLMNGESGFSQCASRHRLWVKVHIRMNSIYGAGKGFDSEKYL